MSEQGITIAIASLERPDHLECLLRELLAEPYRPLEILVVDQSRAAGAGVTRLAAENPRLITYHRVDYRSLPRARNRAWRHARHEAVLFLDDDVRCAPGLLEQHLRCLRQPGVGLVAGGVEEPGPAPASAPPPPTFSRWTAMPGGGFAGLDERDVDHARGANFSAWRAALARVGGFDEGFAVGSALYEELDLCLRLKRAGFRIRFNGRARVAHLQAPVGGCRTVAAADYLGGLAHNRARLIRCNLGLFQRPVALARLLVTGVSMSLRRQDPSLLGVCMAGARRGLAGAAAPPAAPDDSRRPAALARRPRS